MAYDEEVEGEVLEIMPDTYQDIFGERQDSYTNEASGSSEYTPTIIDEYFIRTPRIAR